MNARAYRLDAESQLAESHATTRRDRRREADRSDRTTYVRVGGVWMDADRVPDRADVADLEER